VVVAGAAGLADTGTHTVRRGETASEIAAANGTSVAALVAANSLRDPNRIIEGQVLAIPGAPPAAPTTTTHTVVAGETLAAIAHHYGTTATDLATANGLLPPHLVYSTARLQLDAANRLPNDLATCPVPGATFFNDWGFPRSGGRAHEGNDLFAPRGTQVLAPVAGTVSNRTGSIGGRQFSLTTADGTVILGSHMDSFGTTGPVAAGAVIGTVGSSGNAAGSRPHLHFEVHPGGGAAMNPFPLVRAVCT
jgi:murein DD-endopeptidase MepM/ murein hydrolase activator NlpD